MKKLKISGHLILKSIRGSDGKNRTIDVYAELIKFLALPSDPRAGINYLDISKRSKVLDKLVDAHEEKLEEISLETADYDVICDCIKMYSFGIADPVLDAWIKDILNAPEESADKKSKG